MTHRELTAEERICEISGFSRDFLSRVFTRRVYEPESAGGGYALSSSVRENYHIPTGTASSTIRSSMEGLKAQFGKSGEAPTPFMIERLDEALDHIRKVEQIIMKNPREFPHEYHHVLERVQDDLPEIERTISDLKCPSRKGQLCDENGGFSRPAAQRT